MANITPSVMIFDIWIDYSEYREKHHHDFHEFFLTLDGAGEQLIPEGLQRMKKGEVFFFPAGIEHNGNGSPGGKCCGGVINLQQKSFLGDPNGYPESRAILRSLTEAAKRGQYRVNLAAAGRRELFVLFGKMLEEGRSKKPGYRSMVDSLMHQFLVTILRHSQLAIQTEKNANPVFVDKINDTVQFMKTHFADQIDIDQAAQMANMSRSYFHANFKQVTGVTFVEFLNDLRVKNADQLLRTTQLDTTAIAFRSGFTSVSHFYKVFKEVTGNTPKKVRATQGPRGC